MEKDLPALLFDYQDHSYAALQKTLIPGISEDRLIGVRTPQLRKIAKEMIRNGESEAFLQRLPHHYFEENQLHAFILSEEKDFARCIERIEAFLPYVDNWATCDQMAPKAFKKNQDQLLPHIRLWLHAPHPYAVRFGIKMLMDHYLDEAFDPAYMEMISSIHSEDYYIRMMTAWYFSTALYKQPAAALPYIEQKKLERWTHNKAIQKAVESFRISPEQKEYLKQFRIPSK